MCIGVNARGQWGHQVVKGKQYYFHGFIAMSIMVKYSKPVNKTLLLDFQWKF